MTKYFCDACGKEVSSDELTISYPTYTSENFITKDRRFLLCPYCNNEFSVVWLKAKSEYDKIINDWFKKKEEENEKR